MLQPLSRASPCPEHPDSTTPAIIAPKIASLRMCDLSFQKKSGSNTRTHMRSKPDYRRNSTATRLAARSAITLTANKLTVSLICGKYCIGFDRTDRFR
jgi:hypothetical protein